jgi:hypothetical protein
MKTLKAIVAHMFESPWTYSDHCNVRTNKVTGKVEYWHVDPWGGWYDDEPQFAG